MKKLDKASKNVNVDTKAESNKLLKTYKELKSEIKLYLEKLTVHLKISKVT